MTIDCTTARRAAHHHLTRLSLLSPHSEGAMGACMGFLFERWLLTFGINASDSSMQYFVIVCNVYDQLKHCFLTGFL
jgi:hypothetical protein